MHAQEGATYGLQHAWLAVLTVAHLRPAARKACSIPRCSYVACSTHPQARRQKESQAGQELMGGMLRQQV